MKIAYTIITLAAFMISCSSEPKDVGVINDRPMNMAVLQEILQNGSSQGFTIKVFDWDNQRVVETTKYVSYPSNEVKAKARVWNNSDTKIVEFDGSGYSISTVPGDGGMIAMQLGGKIYQFTKSKAPGSGSPATLYGHPSTQFTLPDGKLLWFAYGIEVQSIIPGPSGPATPAKQEIKLHDIVVNSPLPTYDPKMPEKSYMDLLKLFSKESQLDAQGNAFGAP